MREKVLFNYYYRNILYSFLKWIEKWISHTYCNRHLAAKLELKINTNFTDPSHFFRRAPANSTKIYYQSFPTWLQQTNWLTAIVATAVAVHCSSNRKPEASFSRRRASWGRGRFPRSPAGLRRACSSTCSSRGTARAGRGLAEAGSAVAAAAADHRHSSGTSGCSSPAPARTSARRRAAHCSCWISPRRSPRTTRRPTGCYTCPVTFM